MTKGWHKIDLRNETLERIGKLYGEGWDQAINRKMDELDINTRELDRLRNESVSDEEIEE